MKQKNEINRATNALSDVYKRQGLLSGMLDSCVYHSFSFGPLYM